MTPERRREIDTLRKMYSENLAHQPQHAVNVLVDCVRDLSIEIDSLTAEIATLKAEVEKKRVVTCLYCNTHFEYEKMDDETFKSLYRTMLKHDAECTANPNVQTITTLRTHLKAVVEAGKRVIADIENGRLVENPDMMWKGVERVRGNVSALRSALDKAKE